MMSEDSIRFLEETTRGLGLESKIVPTGQFISRIIPLPSESPMNQDAYTKGINAFAEGNSEIASRYMNQAFGSGTNYIS